MILPTREAAEAARRRVLSGADWNTVSKEVSRAPNAASGGGLGWLERTDLPGEFEKAVWGLPAGGITAALPAGHGVHIFRVEERADGRVVPFEEARPALHLALAEKRSSEAVASLLERSKRRWRVRGHRGAPPVPLRRGGGPLFARLRPVTLLRRLIGTALFASLAFAALPAAGEVVDRILVHVNARIVTQSQLDDRTESGPSGGPSRPRRSPGGTRSGRRPCASC